MRFRGLLLVLRTQQYNQVGILQLLCLDEFEEVNSLYLLFLKSMMLSLLSMCLPLGSVYNRGCFSLKTDELLSYLVLNIWEFQPITQPFCTIFLFLMTFLFMLRSVLYLFSCFRELGSYSSSLTDSNLLLIYLEFSQVLGFAPKDSLISCSRGCRMSENLGGRYLCYQNYCILAISLEYLLLKCAAIKPLPSQRMCYCIVDISRESSRLQLVSTSRVANPEYIDICNYPNFISLRQIKNSKCSIRYFVTNLLLSYQLGFLG